MSLVSETETEFERNARTVLERSISRIDARTRSRLNQARQAALAAASRRRPLWLRGTTLMPATGAVGAALLLAVVLWHREPTGIETPMPEGQRSSMEDMDLLADSEALDLLDGWDGPFYEWATSQTDVNGESNG
jgi:hypothetical protein